MSDKPEQIQEQQAPQQEAQQAPRLTLSDLALTVQVISVATQRGAFQAGELSAVGGLYDRLKAYVDAVQAQSTQEEPEQKSAE